MQSSMTSRCGSRASQRGVATPRALPVPRPLRFSSTLRSSAAVVRAAFNPPPVSESKAKFLEHYKRPIPGIYNVVLQELLVQQHFTRYSIDYQYNEVAALGLVSVFDQILETMEEKERNDIFSAYVRAVGEEPEQYRRDAAALEQAASETDKLTTQGDSAVAKILTKIAEQAASGKLSYSKFFAIGLFRLLEITGAKEPSALENLVKAVGVKPEAVNRDLMLYKNNLAKLATAKELMRDFLEREKKKQVEREADKAARAQKEKEAATANSAALT